MDTTVGAPYMVRSVGHRNEVLNIHKLASVLLGQEAFRLLSIECYQRASTTVVALCYWKNLTPSIQRDIPLVLRNNEVAVVLLPARVCMYSLSR